MIGCCERCGAAGVDLDFKGADGRSVVCDDCREGYDDLEFRVVLTVPVGTVVLPQVLCDALYRGVGAVDSPDAVFVVAASVEAVGA